MKTYYSSFLLFLALLPLIVLSQYSPQLEQLTWLAGCWEGGGNERVINEHWMKPAGGMMMGMSRTVVKGKTVAHEFLQIKQDGSDIFYVAKPSEQQGASFKLIKHSNREAIFENPDHDFPQRIIYRLQSDGSLHARIEGVNKGKERRIDFPMKRVTCD